MWAPKQILLLAIVSALAVNCLTSSIDIAEEPVGDQSIINYITMVLVNIRDIIAAKDPVEAGGFFQKWNDTTEVSGGSANVFNIVWTGLSGLSVDAVTFDDLTFSGNLSFSIPLMDCTGVYNAIGSVSGNAPTTANGTFDYKMTNTRFFISLDFGVANETFEITKLSADFVTEKREAIMSDLTGDAQLEAAFQQLIVDNFDHYYSILQAKANNVAPKLAELGDAILEGISSDNVFNFDMGLIMWKANKLALELAFA